jgi:hypothetical protein
MENLEDVYTIDSRYVSNRQGDIRLNRWAWFKTNPKIPLILVLIPLFFLAPGILLSKWFLILFIITGFALNGFYWRNIAEHFAHGDLIPGKVISLNPTKIAFLTDMTKGVGSFPAIKVIDRKLNDQRGMALPFDQRVAGVALYYEHTKGEYPFWKDVVPHPVQTGTNDASLVNRTLKRIPEKEWKEVDSMLALLTGNPEAALYFIVEENGQLRAKKADQ